MVSVAVMFMEALSSASLQAYEHIEGPELGGFTIATSLERPTCAKVRLHVKIRPRVSHLSDDLC